MPEKEPLPAQGKNVNHGGVFYDQQKSYEKFNFKKTTEIPFERKFVSKKELLRKVESVMSS